LGGGGKGSGFVEKRDKARDQFGGASHRGVARLTRREKGNRGGEKERRNEKTRAGARGVMPLKKVK